MSENLLGLIVLLCLPLLALVAFLRVRHVRRPRYPLAVSDSAGFAPGQTIFADYGDGQRRWFRVEEVTDGVLTVRPLGFFGSLGWAIWYRVKVAWRRARA